MQPTKDFVRAIEIDMTNSSQVKQFLKLPFRIYKGVPCLLVDMQRTPWVNINGMGIVRGHRGVGGTALLFSEMQKNIGQRSFAHADLVQIGSENDPMLRELRSLGVNFYKNIACLRNTWTEGVWGSAIDPVLPGRRPSPRRSNHGARSHSRSCVDSPGPAA